jgi:hypothetical protein
VDKDSTVLASGIAMQYTRIEYLYNKCMLEVGKDSMVL